MSLTYEQFMKNLKKGEVKATEGGGNGYVDAVFTITDAQFIPHSELPEALAEKIDNKDGVFWKIVGTFETEDGKAEKHWFYENALTKKGDIACYPTSEDGQFAGTLLYDLIHGAKELDPEQVKEDWVTTLPKSLLKLKVNMRVRITSNGFVFPETSKQKIKDEKYRQSSTTTYSQASEVNVVNSPSDLPF